MTKIVSDWRKAIEESEYFLALITPNFFDEPESTEQSIYAKQLKKPTIILRLKGLEIPPDWFENVIFELEFTDPEDMIKKLRNLDNELKKILNHE